MINKGTIWGFVDTAIGAAFVALIIVFGVGDIYLLIRDGIGKEFPIFLLFLIVLIGWTWRYSDKLLKGDR